MILTNDSRVISETVIEHGNTYSELGEHQFKEFIFVTSNSEAEGRCE